MKKLIFLLLIIPLIGLSQTKIRYDQLVPIKGSQILNTPSGTISAPNVQAAINELAGEKQAQLNGTGFVKVSGTTVSYDPNTYLPISGGTLTGNLTVTGGNISTNGTIQSTSTNGWAMGGLANVARIQYISTGTGTFSALNASNAYAGFKGTDFESTVTATPPFVVASSQLVTNLNADLLDGQHGSYYEVAGAMTTHNSTYNHANIVYDADFVSQGILLRGASAGTYSVLTDNSAAWNSAADKAHFYLSETVAGLDLNIGTQALSITAGYVIPTTTQETNWNTAYNDRLKWDGGITGLSASTGRTSLGGTTIGQALFTLTNPGSVTFPRFNADNTVSALDAGTFRTAIGAGTLSSETDGSVSNEGILGISTPSVGVINLNSNTSTSQPVQIIQGTGIDLSLSTSSNGGNITIANNAPNISADLSFSGASSPVTLHSSDGTDVTFTAGTNVTFSASGSNMTINASGGLSVYGTGAAGKVIGYDGTYGYSWQNNSLAAGSSTQVQFNNSGALAGDAEYTYNSSTNALTVGSGSGNGSVTSGNFILSSDKRLKERINKMENLQWVDKIEFKNFEFKGDISDRTRYGVIAQEVQKINPELVFTDENGYKSVGYIDLLIAKVARQDEIIEQILKRIEKLENEK